MTQSSDQLSCADFQSQLPDLIGTGEKISDHPHVKSCELCRALIADLESIAEAARQLFPPAEPPDALWKHIEQAMKEEDEHAGPA